MRPEDFRAKDGETALVAVDIQERLFAAIDPAHARRFLKAAANLIALAALRRWPIIAAVQYPKGLGPIVPEIARELEAAGAAPPIEKLDFSACRASGFAARLLESGAKAAVIAGIEAHVCVLETVLDLCARNFRVFVPWDAVASRCEEDRRVALDLMRAAGAIVTSSETIVFQALGRAGTPEFKAFAPRLK
jgi:nicotinamidase-related amidase